MKLALFLSLFIGMTFQRPASAETIFLPSNENFCQLPIGFMNSSSLEKKGELRSLLKDFPALSKRKYSTELRTWPLVTNGKEVISRFHLASGLPPGHRCWTEMSGWSQTEFRMSLDSKSFFGNLRWQLDLQVQLVYGLAKFKQEQKVQASRSVLPGLKKMRTVAGDYIGSVVVIPRLFTPGGFNKEIQSEVKVLGVYNSGSEEKPLATLDLLISIEARGEKFTRLVQANGRGEIQIIQ